MRRRRFLAGVASGALAGVAGCAEGANYDDGTPTPTPTPFPNPGGLAVAERRLSLAGPVAVTAVVANGAESERTGTLVAFARINPDDGDPVSDEKRREVTVPGRSTETFTVDLDVELPSASFKGFSSYDAYIEGNR